MWREREYLYGTLEQIRSMSSRRDALYLKGWELRQTQKERFLRAFCLSSVTFHIVCNVCSTVSGTKGQRNLDNMTYCVLRVWWTVGGLFITISYRSLFLHKQETEIQYLPRTVKYETVSSLFLTSYVLVSKKKNSLSYLCHVCPFPIHVLYVKYNGDNWKMIDNNTQSCLAYVRSTIFPRYSQVLC